MVMTAIKSFETDSIQKKKIHSHFGDLGSIHNISPKSDEMRSTPNIAHDTIIRYKCRTHSSLPISTK